MSEAHGFERFVCLQPQHSLVERNIEREVLPVCVEEGLGVIPWSPLGGGFLSGKYRRGEDPPEDSRIAGAVESMEEYWDRRATERDWAALDVVGRISDETGKSYAQISLNWLLQARWRHRADYRRAHSRTTGRQHRCERRELTGGAGRRTLRGERPRRRLPIPFHPQCPASVEFGRPLGVGAAREPSLSESPNTDKMVVSTAIPRRSSDAGAAAVAS